MSGNSRNSHFAANCPLDLFARRRFTGFLFGMSISPFSGQAITSLPATIEEKPCRPVESAAVTPVISVRGPLLTVRDGDSLWVLRAGPDPRAWKKTVDFRGNGISEWQHGRPPLDKLLRVSRAFPPAATVLIADCRRELDLECDRSVEEREFRTLLQSNPSTFPELHTWPETFERHIDVFRNCKRTAPFPWAWVPGEGERRLRREAPNPEAIGWYREDPPCERQWKRIPPGLQFLEDREVPASITDQAFFRLRWTIRKTLLMRRDLPQWAAHFPEGSLEYLERHDFGTRRWHLLNLWLRVPEGRELWDDIPALAWLAASSWLCKTKPVQRPFRSLRTLVRKPRAHLLRWLDLPTGDGTLALLRSVEPSYMTPLFAHALCRVLRDEEKRRAWHNLPRKVCFTELSLLAYDRPISFPVLRLINEGKAVGGSPFSQRVKDVFVDCLRIIRTLRRDDELRPALARVHSGDRLLAFHDELVRDLGNQEHLRQVRDEEDDIAIADKTPIPPPIPPASWMYPLPTRFDLYDEGSVMHHCVASYYSRVVEGRYYVYALVHPQWGRATLGIRRVGVRQWQVAEMRGKCNEEVPNELRELVYVWLRDQSRTPPPEPEVRWVQGELWLPLEEIGYPLEVEAPRPRPAEQDPEIAAALLRFGVQLGRDFAGEPVLKREDRRVESMPVVFERDEEWDDDIPF